MGLGGDILPSGGGGMGAVGFFCGHLTRDVSKLELNYVRLPGVDCPVCDDAALAKTGWEDFANGHQCRGEADDGKG